MLTIEKVNRLFDLHLKELKSLLKEKGVDLCFDLTEDLHDLENAFYDALGDIDTEIPLEEAMKVIAYNKSELDAGEILPLLDADEIRDYADEIRDYAEGNDCLVIKVDGMVDRQKIKDFVNENIYPYSMNDGAALK